MHTYRSIYVAPLQSINNYTLFCSTHSLSTLNHFMYIFRRNKEIIITSTTFLRYVCIPKHISCLTAAVRCENFQKTEITMHLAWLKLLAIIATLNPGWLESVNNFLINYD